MLLQELANIVFVLLMILKMHIHVCWSETTHAPNNWLRKDIRENFSREGRSQPIPSSTSLRSWPKPGSAQACDTGIAAPQIWRRKRAPEAHTTPEPCWIISKMADGRGAVEALGFGRPILRQICGGGRSQGRLKPMTLCLLKHRRKTYCNADSGIEVPILPLCSPGVVRNGRKWLFVFIPGSRHSVSSSSFLSVFALRKKRRNCSCLEMWTWQWQLVDMDLFGKDLHLSMAFRKRREMWMCLGLSFGGIGSGPTIPLLLPPMKWTWGVFESLCFETPQNILQKCFLPPQCKWSARLKIAQFEGINWKNDSN